MPKRPKAETRAGPRTPTDAILERVSALDSIRIPARRRPSPFGQSFVLLCGRSFGLLLGQSLGLLLVVSCQQGPNKHDVYMEGLQIEGDAERGPCKVHYAEGQAAAKLSGDQLASCLARTQEAIAKYDEAAKLGLDDPDFVKVHARAKERIERLEGMVAQVRKMERGLE